MIDSHCHLDNPQFESDRDAVLQRARDAGVELMIAIGTGEGPPDLEAGIRMAEQHADVYATVGVHPHDASKPGEEDFARLAGLASHPKVVAIGEMGLDYHYNYSPPEEQRRVFIRQLQIARDAGKPIVIHTREAWSDTLAILRAEWRGAGIMHCFTGGPEEAKQALELGFYLSFGGVLTFPKADAVRAAALEAPLDRILVETDAPFLAPVPFRGKRNEPAFVVETARRLADLKGVEYQTLERAVKRNFEQVCVVN